MPRTMTRTCYVRFIYYTDAYLLMCAGLNSKPTATRCSSAPAQLTNGDFLLSSCRDNSSTDKPRVSLFWGEPHLINFGLLERNDVIKRSLPKQSCVKLIIHCEWLEQCLQMEMLTEQTCIYNIIFLLMYIACTSPHVLCTT